MTANNAGQLCLLLSTESGQVGIGNDVGRMEVMLAVRNRQSNLMDFGTPAQDGFRMVIQLPCIGNLDEQSVCRPGNAKGLRGIDTVTFGKCVNAGIA